MTRAALSLLCSLSIFCLGLSFESYAENTPAKPNFIFILTDDLGYNDFGCFGAEDISTPHIDRLAAEGIKLTDFYVNSVCTPSRASFMTGSFAARVNMPGVLFWRHDFGINPDEITIAELLKAQGYATAIIGKWHLGFFEEFLPHNQGFDYWFGLPTSNSSGIIPSMLKFADDCEWRDGYSYDKIKHWLLDRQPNTGGKRKTESVGTLRNTAICPMMRNGEVVQMPADQPHITKMLTEETIQYITENKDRPFFVYLPHAMPHIPLYASENFRGTSQRGLYGDVIQELDWSVGEIMNTLKELKLDDNTFVVLTSDNGPHLRAGQKIGSAFPLRDGKGSTYEGGVRVPFIARWPGKIPADTHSLEITTIMDLLPTFTKLAGGDVPTDRVIDGRDLWPLLSGAPEAQSPHDAYYYFRNQSLRGIRVGHWKYHSNGKGQEALYNLKEDVGEQNNTIHEHPEIAERLKKKMSTFREEFAQNKRAAGIPTTEFRSL
ncbi:MAG: sulfatase family protein [Opitutales bacterium]